MQIPNLVRIFLFFSGFMIDSMAFGQSLPLTDDLMSYLPSSEVSQIKVSDYFPQPESGQVRINEFSSNWNGVDILVGVQRYYRSPDRKNFYLEDHVLNKDLNQLLWYDSWVYHVDGISGSVIEDMDTFSWTDSKKQPLGIFASFSVQRDYPLNHGSFLRKSAMFRTTAVIHQYSSHGVYWGSSHNRYSIWLQDVKRDVTFGKLTLKNVAVQAEQQYNICKVGNCESSTHNYRYYFAPSQSPNEPAIGIVAMQFFDENWKPIEGGFKVLTKTCMVKSLLQVRCP